MSSRATSHHPWDPGSRVLNNRDAFSHGTIVAKRAPSHRRRSGILSSCNFRERMRHRYSVSSCTIRYAEDRQTGRAWSLTSACSYKFSRTFLFIRRDSCRLFPVSFHGEPVHGSRLNHLLWCTTAPRHHLGPYDVQANRLTRKFRAFRVFCPILFSFQLLVTRRWLLSLSVN